MKVAIMGAGLSGLTCAIMLERNGITPTIFEKRNEVGDRFVNAEAFLSILNRPTNDTFRYFAEEFNLFLKPTSHISKFIINGENEQAIINEHIGYINIRGRHPQSIEKQLAEQVNAEIILNANVAYEDLTQEYSHVVLATGDAEYAIKLQNYRKDLSVAIKGATVEGDFDRFSVYVWLNNNLAPKGYAYLLPFSDTEANIVIAHPDLPGDTLESQESLWDRFYKTACTELNQSLKVTDQFQIKNYIIGSCKYPRIGNTIFTGNCFGTIMPFIGFGQFPSILTGIYAAYDMCGQGKYEELTKPLKESYKHSLTLRQVMGGMGNESFDFVIKRMNGYWGEKIFNPSKRDPLRTISRIMRPFVKYNS